MAPSVGLRPAVYVTAIDRNDYACCEACRGKVKDSLGYFLHFTDSINKRDTSKSVDVGVAINRRSDGFVKLRQSQTQLTDGITLSRASLST